MKTKPFALLIAGWVLAFPAASWGADEVLFEFEPNEPGTYISVSGGLSLHADSNVDQSTATLGVLEFGTGSLFGGAVGYQFENPFRIEAEFLHRGYDADRVEASGSASPADGEVSILSFMMNGYHDLPQGKWNPYLGLGFGVAEVSWDEVASPLTPVIDHSDYVFAVQAMAGIGYEITPSLTATAGYRVFGTSDPKFTARNGAVVTGEVIVNEFVLGLRYRF
ncbi:outer membrane protein [Nitrospina watsonii]|uniref:Outer membrane protein beta-barrel domain-containing protein n=1 Tax=Nitrospina watsonii TaxID=1323948 RepID=A0ABN8VTG5_9BACT|nr:outer membrane beta-barrel protein [Nitrospina watsonii]CAI2716988.1 exported protein of unknown function [Nitrospina watsonii]